MKLNPTDTCRDVKEHGFWFFSAPIFGILFVNYANYFLEETPPTIGALCRNNMVAATLSNPKYMLYCTKYEF